MRTLASLSITLCLFHFCLLLHWSWSLNLDPLSPTVVSSGLPSSSEEGFGWTLTQHDLGEGRMTVLVGAPNANGTTLPREGGVYSCPFDVTSTCQFQPLFQNTEVRDDPFSGLSGRSVAFTDQKMGFSLKSSGGIVIACAPHYYSSFGFIQGGGSYGSPSGRCIILNQPLNITTQVFRDRVGTLSLAGLDAQPLPSADGMARSFIFSNSFGDSGNGELILSSSILPLGIAADQQTPTRVAPVNTLRGFHLEVGRFTQLTSPEIVASSPRGELHLGKVDVYDATNLPLGPLRSFTGEEIDGYFGYDFAVLDLGHGGYSSLAVGCPLCDIERGRVYIYAHTGAPSTDFVRSVIFAPSPRVRGRFGLAVENIGDVDLDGLSDLAVSAPYEGQGRVYIYRGTETGVVLEDYQTLEALAGSSVFGYILSGGLDMDGNGYPDLTVGDVGSERITTLRASPLVNVTLVIQDLPALLDITGSSDRKCLLDGTLLHCFNVTPCFYYEPKVTSLPQFSFQYELTVAGGTPQVSQYIRSPGGDAATLGGSVVTRNMTVVGTGVDNMACDATLTFALQESFVVKSVPVSLSVSDMMPTPYVLEVEPALAEFGAPLHPRVMRYVRGDVRAPLTLDFQVPTNVDCRVLQRCEGNFTISSGDLVGEVTEDGHLLLAPANEFGYTLTVTNIAPDTAINPVLIINLPPQVLLTSTYPPTACNSLRQSNMSSIECPLKSAINSGEALRFEVSFMFNDTSALLGVSQLGALRLSVRDGVTGRVFGPVTHTLELDAVGEYALVTNTFQSEYRADRRALLSANASSLPLPQVGPLLTLQVSLRNSLNSSMGAPFPRSTLYIHVPVDLLEGEGEGQEARPLLIPFNVVVNELESSSIVNCSQYRTIPQNLSPAQDPGNFRPVWTGPAPPPSEECKQDGRFRCGTIICTVFGLQPFPEPPTVATLFAYLYSPSVDESLTVTVYSEVVSDTSSPSVEPDSIQMHAESFELAPPPREVPRECIRYWVVVVSVVIGIFAVTLIIIVLAMCGVFRRWYKIKQEDQDGVEQTDQELSYQRRTIPPLNPQHLTNGAPSSSPPPAEEPQQQPAAAMSGHEKEEFYNSKEMEKEMEAEEEFQQELKRMAGSKYEPDGLDLGEGLETDL